MKNLLPILLVFFFGQVLSITSLAAKNETELYLTVFHKKGTVFAYKGTKSVRQIKKNDKVYVGETVHSKDKSLLVLEFSNKSKLKVDANSIIRIEKLINERMEKGGDHKNSLVLKLGSVFMKYVNKQKEENFVLKTRSASMGVRGTEFFAHIGGPREEKLAMTVNEGVVVVSSEFKSEQREVSKSFGTLVKSDGSIVEKKQFKWSQKLNWNQDPEEGNLETPAEVFKQIEADWDLYAKDVEERRDQFFQNQEDQFKKYQQHADPFKDQEDPFK